MLISQGMACRSGPRPDRSGSGALQPGGQAPGGGKYRHGVPCARLSPPAEIAGLIGDMQRILPQHPELLSLDAMQAYFREVYWRMGEDGLDEKKICERFRIARSGTDFAYRSAAADFRMIESGMEPVIVPLDEKAREAVARLGVEKISSGAIARQLQGYVVQVPPKARALLIANGQAGFVNPELRGDQFAVLRNMSLYEEDVGLIWEDADYLAVEDLIV